MSDNNVKGYSNVDLLRRVKQLKSFVKIPDGYWLLGVQSNEDAYNKFDDKFYLFHKERFIMVAPGTTNAGETGIKRFFTYNKKGVLVVKTDEWYYGLWAYGLHRGKMRALRQVLPIKYYRDGNKNESIEETGELYEGIKGINFHTISYTKKEAFIKKFIGGWSAGCQVVNDIVKYYAILNLLRKQKSISYCLIKEF